MPNILTTPAKINLFLDVLGVRENGYHDIVTVFTSLASPADVVSLEPTAEPGICVRCEHPAVPEDEANICWRAVREFCNVTGTPEHWSVRIRKKIPVAAGLGGGSSDAAATLRLLNTTNGHPLDRATVTGMAARIGADVPFFLGPTAAALGTGIGDLLKPLHITCRLPVILVHPGFPVPVAWSFANLARVKRPRPAKVEALTTALAEGDLAGVARNMYNALEHAVCDKFPMVEMIIEHLRGSGCAAAQVSGSGPTVFGLCADVDPNPIAASLRDQLGAELWICITHINPTEIP